MGSLVHRILKNSPHFRFTSSTFNLRSPILTHLLSLDPPISTDDELAQSRAQQQAPALDFPTSNHAPNLPHSLPFRSNYSYGYFSNPVNSNGSCPFGEKVVEGVGSDEGTIWADSVKKKRKKKMNKHKYRKLRKRLRRKT
ncbi:hypothetical protein AKJ16_DCAP08145 [Drosera capensis]